MCQNINVVFSPVGTWFSRACWTLRAVESNVKQRTVTSVSCDKDANHSSVLKTGPVVQVKANCCNDTVNQGWTQRYNSEPSKVKCSALLVIKKQASMMVYIYSKANEEVGTGVQVGGVEDR